MILAIVMMSTLQPTLQAAPQGWKSLLKEIFKPAERVESVAQNQGEETPSASTETTVDVASPLSGKQIYDELLKSTVWIKTPSGGHATGWIYDKENGLVVTNHHVVAGIEYVNVFPPKFEDGQLVTDKEEYERYTRPITGFVMDSEVRRDLAVIKINTELPGFTQSLKLAEKSASPAEQVHVIGGLPEMSDGMFVYANGHVRQVAKGKGLTSSEYYMVQMTVPVNRGNSGGAIVNNRAELVGVTSAHYPGVENVSDGTDVREVKSYLETIESIYPPKSPKEIYEVGLRHYWANRMDTAARHFTKALKDDAKLSDAYRMRGYTYRVKKDPELAMADFESAIKINPSDADAHHGRGLVHMDARRYESAQKDLTEAIRLDPTVETAHYNRGLVHYSMRKYEAALKDYSRTIEINRYNAGAFIQRGLVYSDMKRVDAALKDFETSATIRPSAVAYNNIGVVHRNKKNFRLAVDNFIKATRLDPKYFLAWENLGELYLTSKQYEDSISHLAYALELNPNSARALYLRAQSELAGGNKQHALSDVNKAIKMYPKFADYYVLRSLINHELGNEQAANDDYQVAAKLDPKSYAKHNVAKPSVPNQNNIQGSWRVQTTVRGVKFNSIIRFTGNGYAFTSNWVDVNGQHGQTKGRGTFVTNNGTLTLRDNYGQVSNHAIGFNNGQLALQFPGMNSNQSVLLWKS